MTKSIRDREMILSDLLPTDAYSRQVMIERARILAKTDEQITDKEDRHVEYVKFKMGENESYGIPYVEIENIEIAEAITTVPRVPDFVAGIYYQKGNIIPVIDLSVYFKIGLSGKNNHFVIATMSLENMLLGLLFQDVIGIDQFNLSSLDKPISEVSKIKESYIVGIDKGVTAILNTKNLMKDISRQLMGHKEIEYARK